MKKEVYDMQVSLQGVLAQNLKVNGASMGCPIDGASLNNDYDRDTLTDRHTSVSHHDDLGKLLAHCGRLQKVSLSQSSRTLHKKLKR
jgi:hypothetical protein